MIGHACTTRMQCACCVMAYPSSSIVHVYSPLQQDACLRQSIIFYPPARNASVTAVSCRYCRYDTVTTQNLTDAAMDYRTGCSICCSNELQVLQRCYLHLTCYFQTDHCCIQTVMLRQTIAVENTILPSTDT